MNKCYFSFQKYVFLFFLSYYFVKGNSISAQQFVNVSDLLAISDQGNVLTWGNGVSFYDIDGDGWDDITFAPYFDSLRIFKNVGGSFVQIPSPFMVDADVKQILWVDYDNDRILDLFFTVNNGSNRLYKNLGNFNFVDVTVASGLNTGNIPIQNYGAAFGDFDKDGDLDLYITTYAIGMVQNELLNKLYRNNGDGTFTDITIEVGVYMPGSTTFLSLWFDVNDDSWPDLYVINDRIFSNYLFINGEGQTFSNRAEDYYLDLPGENCMSGTLGDFNNDGLLDIFISNTTYFLPAHLLQNTGFGNFIDVAQEMGVSENGTSWGGLWIDYDNDTYQDLFVATSNLGLFNDSMANFLYKNLAGSNFEDVSTIIDNNPISRSYSPVRGDFNNDGFYDLAVSSAPPTGKLLYQNHGNSNNYIKITLKGTISNSHAIGSYIRVYANGNEYTQYTLCGENYLGQNSQNHIFGLSDFESVDSVKVQYLSGHVDNYYNLAVNQNYNFTEGETYLATVNPSGNINLCAGEQITLDAGEHHSVLWSNGSTQRYLTVTSAGAYIAICQNEFGITAIAEPVYITINLNPVISAEITHPSCSGYNDGAILLNNTVGIPASEVFWNGNIGEASHENLEEGSYVYTYKDVNTCEASGKLSLYAPEELLVIFITTPDNPGTPGTISSAVFGGTPPFQFFIDNEPVSFPIESIGQGSYLINVVDSNNCMFEEQVLVSGSVMIDEINTKNLSINPNPFETEIRINCERKMTSFAIQDFAGRLIKKGIINQNIIKDLNGIESGNYLLRISDYSGRNHYFKILKK